MKKVSDGIAYQKKRVSDEIYSPLSCGSVLGGSDWISLYICIYTYVCSTLVKLKDKVPNHA